MSHRIRRGPRERALAWLYTGPLGHLYGTVVDISVVWTRWAAGVGRTRMRRALGR